MDRAGWTGGSGRIWSHVDRPGQVSMGQRVNPAHVEFELTGDLGLPSSVTQTPAEFLPVAQAPGSIPTAVGGMDVEHIITESRSSLGSHLLWAT